MKNGSVLITRKIDFPNIESIKKASIEIQEECYSKHNFKPAEEDITISYVNSFTYEISFFLYGMIISEE